MVRFTFRQVNLLTAIAFGLWGQIFVNLGAYAWRAVVAIALIRQVRTERGVAQDTSFSFDVFFHFFIVLFGVVLRLVWNQASFSSLARKFRIESSDACDSAALRS